MSMTRIFGAPTNPQDLPRIPRAVNLDDLERAIEEKPLPALHPRAGEFLNNSIIKAAKEYTQLVVDEYERLLEKATKDFENAKAWADNEIERARLRAEDVASAHAEMVESREKFLALPRASAGALTDHITTDGSHIEEIPHE